MEPVTVAPFGSDELKAASRVSFVDNECGSDEYRETQPAKLLGHVARAAEILRDLEGDAPRTEKRMVALLGAWSIAALADWGTPGWTHIGYGGAEAAEPLLALVHDVLWDAGEHPYYGTAVELDDFLDESEPEPLYRRLWDRVRRLFRHGRRPTPLNSAQG